MTSLTLDVDREGKAGSAEVLDLGGRGWRSRSPELRRRIRCGYKGVGRGWKRSQPGSFA